MQIKQEVDDGRRKPRIRTVNEMESRTIQSDRNRAEMREILRRYESMGIVDHMANVDLLYRDVSEFEDFADLMRQSKEAEKEFMKLPPKVRQVFGHDVHTWLDAAHDPEKLEALRPKLEKLGVMEPKAPERAPQEPAPAPPQEPA